MANNVMMVILLMVMAVVALANLRLIIVAELLFMWFLPLYILETLQLTREPSSELPFLDIDLLLSIMVEEIREISTVLPELLSTHESSTIVDEP